MKKHKTHIYIDRNLPCDIAGCGRHFVSPQALRGHQRMIHGIRNPTVDHGANPGALEARNDQVKSSEDTIKELRNEVATLKLGKQKRQLEAEFPAAAPGSRDLMDQAGLGTIEGEAKTLAQMRALGLNQGQAPSWFDKVLANPEAVRIGVDAVRGVLGTNRNGGDNMATLLKDLGFNLKDLILGATSPKSGSLEIAGINLNGVSMTPQLLVGLLEYKAKHEAAEAEIGGKKVLADALTTAVEKLSPAITELLNKRRGQSISREIFDREPAPVVDDVVTCPKCGTENKLPPDLVPGQKIQCQGEGCQESWLAVDRKEEAKAQSKVERKKRQVEVKEPEPLTEPCPNCGQLLDITNRTLGEIARCPICDKEWTLISGSQAIKAEEPLTESEKLQKEYLDR